MASMNQGLQVSTEAGIIEGFAEHDGRVRTFRGIPSGGVRGPAPAFPISDPRWDNIASENRSEFG
jgi:hypothetical protein